MPAPIQNFDGVSNVNGLAPPDTEGEVGPNHYVQWVNLSFAVYNKTGGLVYGPAPATPCSRACRIAARTPATRS